MTTVTYEATAGQTEYQITFPYLSESHLAVSVNGTPTSLFTITGGDTVVLDGSFVILAGDAIKIERQTPLSELLATFASTTTLRASELARAFKQLLFGLQELGSGAFDKLGKVVGGLAWDAASLPMRNLGAPSEGGDAATKAYVDLIGATNGVLPIPDATQIGLGIRVRGGSGGPEYAIGAINGAETTFVVPTQTTGALGFNGGYELAKLGASSTGTWRTNNAAKVPLELESSAGTPTFGAFAVDGNGTDILVPRGTFEVTAEGSVRSLTATTDINEASAAAQLSFGAGTQIDLRSDLILGYGGGAGGIGDNRDPAPFPKGTSGYMRLKGFVTFLAPTRVYLHMSASTQGDLVVADTPWRLRLKEVVL